MKNLLIIGASGFGRHIYDIAKESLGYGKEFTIKGFLDFNIDALNDNPFYPQVISSEDDYVIQENDVFLCALGNVEVKKKCTNKIINRGGEFITIIHRSAILSPTCTIGNGSIIGPNSNIGSGVVVGNHVLIQADVFLGHDAKIGDFCRLDMKSVCVGGVEICNMVVIHTAAVISHNVIVNNNAIIGACSFVINEVKERNSVFGVPARVLKDNS